MSKPTFAKNQDVIDRHEDSLRENMYNCQELFNKKTKVSRQATYTITLNHDTVRQLYDLLNDSHIGDERFPLLEGLVHKIEGMEQND